MATRFWQLCDSLSVLVPTRSETANQKTQFPAFITYCSTEEALNLDPWTEREESMMMAPIGPAQAKAAKEIQETAHAEAVAGKDVLGYAKWVSAGSLMSGAAPLVIQECSVHTGSRVWEGLLLHLKWAFMNLPLLTDRSVLEIGAGCGLLGLALAKAGSQREIVISDFKGHFVDDSTQSLMHILLGNAKANEQAIQETKVSIWELNWAKPRDAKCCWSQGGDSTQVSTANFDVIVGSEVIYSTEGADLLLKILPTFLAPDGTCYILNNSKRSGVAGFVDGCSGAQLTCQEMPFEELAANELVYTMGKTTLGNTYTLLKITWATPSS
jgi:predicted nicotinamide N-methyase